MPFIVWTGLVDLVANADENSKRHPAPIISGAQRCRKQPLPWEKPKSWERKVEAELSHRVLVAGSKLDSIKPQSVPNAEGVFIPAIVHFSPSGTYFHGIGDGSC